MKTFGVLLGDLESAYDEINGFIAGLEHYGLSASESSYELLGEMDDLKTKMYRYETSEEGCDLMKEAITLLKRIGAY